MARALTNVSQSNAAAGEVDENELHCIVCEHQFSDDIIPRNLLCGHTVCTVCISDYFLRNKDKNCPVCRQPFYARTASDLPINHPILKLSKSVAASKYGGKPKWDNKVIIVDNGSGPVWRPSPFKFTCEISKPQKQSEFFGMKNYIAYTVTPSFSPKHVSRRYKQFDLIQEKFRNTFPLIVLPKLPEKQILGKFDEELIEYRQSSLQSWISQICKHPILSQSDIFRLFITVSNEKSWDVDSKKFATESQLHQNFFSNVQLPQSYVDLQQLEKKIECYALFVNELDKAIKELHSSSLFQANEYQVSFKREKEEINRAFLRLAESFSLSGREDPELPLLIFRISEAYSDLAFLCTKDLGEAWHSLHELLGEYQLLVSELNKILSVARKYLKLASQPEAADNTQEATCSSYVFLAEVAHLNQNLVIDIKKIIKVIIEKQFLFYQEITNRLRKKLEEIMNDGKETPSAPTLELFE